MEAVREVKQRKPGRLIINELQRTIADVRWGAALGGPRSGRLYWAAAGQRKKRLGAESHATQGKELASVKEVR